MLVFAGRVSVEHDTVARARMPLAIGPATVIFVKLLEKVLAMIDTRLTPSPLHESKQRPNRSKFVLH